jgi:hypothetical protein
VAGGDSEIGEQISHQLAAHRRAAVGMDRQLVRADRLLLTRGRDQPLREACALGAPATIQPTT